MTETTALTEGAIAETTHPYKDIPSGSRFVVEEFWDAPTPGDERHGDDSFFQEDVYLGSNRGGFNNVIIPARYVRAVTNEQVLAEKAVVSSVASALHSSDLGVQETSTDGARIFVSGSDKGLPFSFTLTVEDFQLDG